MMGSFSVPIVVSTLDGLRSVRTRALVDTASTLVVLPPSMVRELGLTPVEERRFRLGNEEVVTLPVTNAWVELEGRSAPTQVVIGPAEGEPILGVTILEILGFAVDPVAERLVPVEHLLKPLAATA